MNRRILGGLLLVAAVITIISVAYLNSQRRNLSLVFSPAFMMNALWNDYKNNYIEASSGRTLDKQRSNITTSEGQSYTLLRSVWQDDKPTFDSSFKWLQENLKRSDDNLYSWVYGQRENGTWGILTEEGGENSASDADTDIAVALLFASSRWKDDTYRDEALKIINDIWEQEVITINGTPYLTANNIEKNSLDRVIVNLSYFAPYAYRMFAQVDPSHDWNELADSSYSLIERSMGSNLNKSKTANLPPNWVVLNRSNGNLEAPPTSTLDTNYGFDAFRIPWRLYLDYSWNNEQRAKAILEKMSFLSSQWQQLGVLYPIYTHDGRVVMETESPAAYGGNIGYFLATDPGVAEKIYTQKLASLYNPDTETWKTQLSYYDDNWAWFGIALYNKTTTNLFQTSTTTAHNIKN